MTNANHPHYSIHHLTQMGWNAHFQNQLDPASVEGAAPARVTGVTKNRFRLSNGQKEWLAAPAGRLRHEPGSLYPVAGDWVLATDALILRVLIRQNALSRGASGSRHKQEARSLREQVIAANLDTVFIVSGLDRDFNLRRIERYLTLVYNCGLSPAIILTKADLHKDPGHAETQVATVAFGVPICLVSALDDDCLAPLACFLSPGRTTTLVGSSGAGKSTLVNRLCGKAVQETRSVSTHVGKGRHTTTTRDLIMMPQGGMVIDNPGIREIAFWEGDEGVETSFPDIERLATQCRFSDCSHTREPGCRVLAAVHSKDISEKRLENYRKMKRELDYFASRRHKSADRLEKERWKGVAQKIRAMKTKK